MARKMTLRDAAERLISDLAVRAYRNGMEDSGFAIAVAEACRLIEAGNAHAAIVRLAASLPEARCGAWERIQLVRMHPAETPR
jgi:hypothetical protein